MPASRDLLFSVIQTKKLDWLSSFFETSRSEDGRSVSGIKSISGRDILGLTLGSNSWCITTRRLTVTVNGGTLATVNGVTVSGIAIDNSGNVTADVAASCSASNATFTLRVTDPGGLYAEDTLTVNVTANATPPVITLKSATILQPNVNHKYRTFTMTQMVQSATDDCDGNVISSVVIEKATSDEPDGGDGTLNDIVIASGCKSVQLRAERDGTKNGRVYHITLGVKDSSGNVTTAVYNVSVPVGKAPAVDSGVAYTVNGCSP